MHGTPIGNCSPSEISIPARTGFDAAEKVRRRSLLTAFHDTEYRVDTGAGQVAIRIGSECPDLDRWADRREWFIITAFNPDGIARSNRLNRESDRQLRERLARMADACIVLPANNHDAYGCWPDEPAWWVAGADSTQRDELARRFGQCALVIGGAGQPAALLLYGPDWDFDLPAWARRAARA